MTLPFSFVYPWVLLLVLAAIPMVYFMSRRQTAVGHPAAGMHKGRLRSYNLLAWFTTLALVSAWTAMCIAFAQPQLAESMEKETREVRDIVINVDISGSMNGRVRHPDKPQYNRLNAAKDVTCAFIARREGDRVGIMLFDDQSYTSWPLTTDIEMLLRRCQRVDAYLGGGTNFEGPTETDRRVGAIQGPLNHLREFGQAKTKVIVLVTDGEAPISERRMQELVQQVEDMGVRVYVIGIGHEWTNENNSQTRPLREFVRRVDGVVFAGDDMAAFEAAIEQIDQLEKSRVEIERTVTYRDLYHYFLMASVAGWVLFLLGAALTRETA